MTAAAPPRVLVIAPFTHQNGHFVTFPRDVCCGLAASGCDVTLVHARPFRTELDWFGHPIRKICLKDLVDDSPRLWRELWARLASHPSSQCLAWVIWRMKPANFDLVLWTDFQAQANVWPLAITRRLGVYRFRSAFFEHHPPEDEGSEEPHHASILDVQRLRLGNVPMIVFSRSHLASWRARLGMKPHIEYLPYGVWPRPLDSNARAEARVQLNIAPEVRVVLVFGVQAVKRKNLDTLLDALQGFSPRRPLMLLFVGKTIGGQAHPFLGWNAVDITVRVDDRFVSESDMNRYFAATDAVWANYRDFPGASGALQQAIGFGRMVIASDGGEIHEICKEHQLGITVESPTSEGIQNSFVQLLDIDGPTQLELERHIANVASRYSWDRVMGTLHHRFIGALHDGCSLQTNSVEK